MIYTPQKNPGCLISQKTAPKTLEKYIFKEITPQDIKHNKKNKIKNPIIKNPIIKNPIKY